MRKRFLLPLLVLLLTTLSTHAYDFQSGDLYYNITSENTVEVTYQESWSSTNYQGLTTATIPETVTYNGTTYSVTSIGSSAFNGCSSLTSITIPNSVTSIGWGAFFGCSSLTSMVVESGNTMYDSRDNCNAIIETATNTLIAGCQSTTIPNSVTSIGEYAFYYCSSLTSVTIPNSVTSIGDDAFTYCSALTSLTIPNSVTSIGDWAFSGCSALTSLTIPNSVTSIGDYAFGDIPNVVYNGTATGSPWGARSVNGYVDGYLVYADETKTTLLACSAAATGEITILNSVTIIGYEAFRGCSSLTSITIPNSVTSIGEGAFYMCSSLTTVTIGNSVEYIDDIAFGRCSALADIYCYATTPPVCYEDRDRGSFYGVNKHCRIHVPVGTIDAYQWAPVWRDFYHFYEISELPDGTPTDQVGVTVTGNYATFTWPFNPTASSYTLTITKDGEVFCTLIFNNMGQLVGMAFAPARDGKPSANQSDAQSTAYGFSFVVTNLDANSHYTYTFTVNGADSEVIETYSGSFDTSEETAIPATQQDNQPSRKVLRNGQVVIIRNGETYDMMGQRL